MADREGFDAFVASRSDALLRTGYLLTLDWQQAEDLLQVALTKSWFAWRRIERAPEAYVRRVMVTTYASWWRRKWRGERPVEVLPDPGAPDQTGAVDDRDEVWRLLALLPRRQRAVVALRYVEDLPEAEVADLLGISVGAVKSQASRGLAALRLHVTTGGAR